MKNWWRWRWLRYVRFYWYKYIRRLDIIGFFMGVPIIRSKYLVPEWRKHPNPYLQLHLEVYPNYLKERDAGTYDPAKDPFCSASYILSHPFENFQQVEDELDKQRRYKK